MADKPDFFQTALSNFVADAAYGGAVRHLTDGGCTLNQIMGRLDYPAPRGKVQKLMMEYLYESKVLLRQEPSAGLFSGREVYVQEQDSYGRRSMRKISVDSISQQKMTQQSSLADVSLEVKNADLKDILWKEISYKTCSGEKLTSVLHRKCEENGEQYCYAECRFSFLNSGQEKMQERKGFSCLNNRQKEYLEGILWETPVTYHRLNQRMREIVGKLYEAGEYQGVCYFLRKGEKLMVG